MNKTAARWLFFATTIFGPQRIPAARYSISCRAPRKRARNARTGREAIRRFEERTDPLFSEKRRTRHEGRAMDIEAPYLL